jgi:two-component system sensor histidine kinase YesM
MDEQGYILSSIDKSELDKCLANEGLYQYVKGQQEGYYLNQNQLISFYKIVDPGWYVIKIDNPGKIMNVQIINYIILICIFLTMFFAISFMYIQRKQIINPVTELSKEVRKFRDGQYMITVHKDSGDEIGELNKCFVEMGIYIQDLIERVYKSKLSEKEAQLKYLQSQINPHFLYNTLDSIRWMAIKEKRMDIATQIEALSNLFKHATNDGKEMTTVEKEVEHLKNYITIQKNRLGDLLEVKIEVDEDLSKYSVVNLILQPLVENAIEHGLENKLGLGVIKVIIKHENDMIHYIVEDNGLGTDERLIQNRLNGKSETHNALALVNINKRIKYKYGEKYGICFFSEIGVGTRVEIVFPVEAM